MLAWPYGRVQGGDRALPACPTSVGGTIWDARLAIDRVAVAPIWVICRILHVVLRVGSEILEPVLRNLFIANGLTGKSNKLEGPAVYFVF